MLLVLEIYLASSILAVFPVALFLRGAGRDFKLDESKGCAAAIFKLDVASARPGRCREVGRLEL